jgi:hypothetical protein
MLQNPNFLPAPILGKDEKEEMSEKRQVSYWVDPEIDEAITDEVFARKKRDRLYSATKLTNEALRIYLMVIRLQREFGDISEPYDLVRSALAQNFGKKKAK